MRPNTTCMRIGKLIIVNVINDNGKSIYKVFHDKYKNHSENDRGKINNGSFKSNLRTLESLDNLNTQMQFSLCDFKRCFKSFAKIVSDKGKWIEQMVNNVTYVDQQGNLAVPIVEDCYVVEGPCLEKERINIFDAKEYYLFKNICIDFWTERDRRVALGLPPYSEKMTKGLKKEIKDRMKRERTPENVKVLDAVSREILGIGVEELLKEDKER